MSVYTLSFLNLFLYERPPVYKNHPFCKGHCVPMHAEYSTMRKLPLHIDYM